MRVIGTAGHVDHGKSTLVNALTGIDPDRLTEEKRRGMTIDLGFAWFDTPHHDTIGIVDVPGHRDFIENMLAGVQGIDAVLLVIACDEGVMPQTREHLAIIDLLGIPRGIIVLTKTDLVDIDWQQLVAADVRQAVQNTLLAEAQMLFVSAHTGAGIAELKEALISLTDSLPPYRDQKHPFLPIDRVFTMDGFGTVVTGTLSNGGLRIGDEVALQPSGISARIRGLQSYRQAHEHVLPGNRVAVNLVGIHPDAIQRGNVLTLRGDFPPTSLLDVYYHHLTDAPPLKHNTDVKCYFGTSEVMAKVRLLDAEQVTDGDAWLQLVLTHPVSVLEGSRGILRRPSPPLTLGGATVVNAYPPQRWKRHHSPTLDMLSLRRLGTPQRRLLALLATTDGLKQSDIVRQLQLIESDVSITLADLVAAEQVLHLPDQTFLSRESADTHIQHMTKVLQAYHAANPLRVGIPREELRRRLNVRPAVYAWLLDHAPQITRRDEFIALNDAQPLYTAQQQSAMAHLMAQFQASPYAPPAVSECVALVTPAVYQSLIERHLLVQVSPQVVYLLDTYTHLVSLVLHMLDTTGHVDVKMLRDTTQSSRKFAIALLEHLDEAGITRREGDLRVRATTIFRRPTQW